MLELRWQYLLAGLLRASGLARRTFYYQQKALQMNQAEAQGAQPRRLPIRYKRCSIAKFIVSPSA